MAEQIEAVLSGLRDKFLSIAEKNIDAQRGHTPVVSRFEGPVFLVSRDKTLSDAEKVEQQKHLDLEVKSYGVSLAPKGDVHRTVIVSNGSDLTWTRGFPGLELGKKWPKNKRAVVHELGETEEADRVRPATQQDLTEALRYLRSLAKKKSKK